MDNYECHDRHAPTCSTESESLVLFLMASSMVALFASLTSRWHFYISLMSQPTHNTLRLVLVGLAST